MMDGKNATGLHDRTVGSYGTAPHVTDGSIYLGPLSLFYGLLLFTCLCRWLSTTQGSRFQCILKLQEGDNCPHLLRTIQKEVPYYIHMTNCVLISDKVGVLLHYLYFRLWSYLLCMCMHVHCLTYKISGRSMIYKTSCFRFEGMKAIQVMSSNCK